VNDARLSSLVSRYLDGQLTREERSEFEAAVRHSATAREQVWQEAKLHALLHEAEKGGSQLVVAKPLNRRRPWRALSVLAAAAGLALVVLWNGGAWRTDAVATPIEQTTTAVAVLSRSLDATWRSPGEAHAVGDVLQPGWLHLTSGLAHVEFYNGVRVVLEGPSDLQVISGHESHLSQGRLRAEVPEVARGFTVTTPQLQVVDLGTEFGVAVTGSMEEVHVFQGRVTLKTAGGPVQEVPAGQARAVINNAEPHAIPSTPAAFAKAVDLERKAMAAQDQRQQVWQQAAIRWDADAALLVHFDFAKDAIADRTLRNRAAAGAAAGDGIIVGCAHVEGRWPNKQALEFHTESDRVRVRVPGEHHALTLIAWVRVDALERPFNSLFMTDAFAVGAVHWQIRQNGSLHITISAPPGQSAERYNFDSPGIFTDRHLGRWLQLCMVYDGPQRQVTQYVDGESVGRFTVTDDVALRIGHGELGNWNPVDAQDGTPIRNLTGRMDEFALFSRALAAQEISDLYRSGSGSAPLGKP
jgi:ferric-dicitrate binding protein FerR (iron transport regulator)